MMRILTILFCSFILFSCDEKVGDPLVVKDVTLEDSSSMEPPPPPPLKKSDETGTTSNNNRQPRAADNEHWKKKKTEGVDFMVIGNEPFWNLEIRNGKSLRFHLSDWEKPVNIPFSGSVEKSKFNEVGANNIQVRIVPQECSDGMSDYGYDYSVTVIYKGVTYKGCGIAL